MRRLKYWGAAICVAAVFGGGAVPSTADLGFIGIRPAEAKAFYTRKRVKGRWITGRFAKNSALKNNRALKNRAPISLSGKAGSPEAATRVASFPALGAESGPAAVGLATSPAPSAAASPLVPVSEDERLRTLREALQARVSALSTGTLSAAQAARPAPEPQSVSLDFKSGTKTTIFSDGTSIQEAFDVNALKGLAAVPPGAKAGLE